MTCIFHITRFDSCSTETMLEGFVGTDAKATYDKAFDRLDYWWNKYPNAYIDITRKA